MTAKADGNKTRPTQVSVEAFLARAPPGRAQEARELCELMSRLSGETAKMWGPSIVGFGIHHYRYESGREGVTPAIAFSPRKPAIVLYGLSGSVEGDEGLAKLGNVTTGKGCIYIKRLSDVNLDALEGLISKSMVSRRKTSVGLSSGSDN